MLVEPKVNMTKLNKAILIFNKLSKDGVIEQIIKDMRPLDSDYTNVTRSEVAKFFWEHAKGARVTVELYRPWYWRSKAYATTITGNYELIKLNKYRINRTVASLCGSIAHEDGHLVEFYTNRFIDSYAKFNHGNNKPVGKEDTFQYQLGKAVKKYVEENLERLLQDIGA
jgi:hypothetical protein